ncbi:MAG: MBL fold metallo-hydrolase [Planctomycetota bacterium]
MPQLILLGTAGYHPSERRQTSCALVPESGIVVDAGTGLFRLRDYIQTETLDIFLSHAHLDHTIGLTFLYDVIFERPLKRITVHGLADKLEALERHLFNEHLFPVAPPYESRAFVAGDSIALADCVVQTFPLEHPGGSTGLRFNWPDRSMAVITDTTARDDAPYLEHIGNLDLLVHECFFPEGDDALADKTGHSCAGPVGAVARKVQPKQLVLSHVNPLDNVEPPIDTAEVDFPGVILGHDHQVIEF